eukprot:gene3720-7392_t
MPVVPQPPPTSSPHDNGSVQKRQDNRETTKDQLDTTPVTTANESR